MAEGRQSQKCPASLIEAIHFLESVSVRIHGLLDEGSILRKLKRGFAQLERYSVTVLLLTDDGSGVKIAETSLAAGKRKKGENVPRLKGRKIDLSKSNLLSRVVKDAKTVQADLAEATSEWFPPSVAEWISNTVSSQVQAVMTPLRRDGEVIGVLGVSGAGLSEHLVPSVERLAQHISVALELARDYADRRRVEEELRSSREQLRSLSGYLQSVREEERTHIAREMHDELGQTLTALKADLSWLKTKLSKEEKAVLKKIESMSTLTDRTIQTLQRISAELRPRVLDVVGLTGAIEWQTEEFQDRTGIGCVLNVDSEDIVLEKDLSTAIFRIFQEALTNVARHSSATKVNVSLERKGSRLELEVRDNGRGITQEQVSGLKSFGLIGIRERVRYLGGELKISGIKNKGTTLTLTIPIEEPTEGRFVSTPRLVGREKELRRLRSLLKRTDKEEGKLVLIHGEAGVGKTRLVTEFGQDLETRGATVLLGGCREDTLAVAYYPFREAFSRFLEVRKEEGLSAFESLPDYSQWELARVVPGLKEIQPSEFEPAKDHFRLFEAFRLFIENLATRSEGPLLLTVEDLHLSGDATLDLLHYLARNLSRSKILLCATYRSEEAGESLQRFAHSLQKEGLSESVTLKPLSTQDVSAMVDLLCPGVEAPPEFRDLLYQKSEGNPLFVEELVKLVPEEEVTEGLSALKEVPHSIQAVLKRRVDSLDSGVREILSCAAVVGEEFEFEVLRGALDRPEMEVMEAVEVGARAHLIRESTRGEEERYRFIHALMADVLYSGIGKARRRLWHGQVGGALEQVYAGRLGQLNGQLSYHFELGEDWEKALKYALTSAKQAKEAYANQEAIRLYEKAREILPRLTRECDDERIGIAEGLGDVHKVKGEWEKALQEYRLVETLARTMGDENKEGGALSRISGVRGLQGDYDDAVVCAERSYEIYRKTGNQQGLAESLRQIGEVHHHRGDYEEALDYSGESLAILRDIGNKKGVALSLNTIGDVHRDRGDYVEALRCYEESLRIRRELNDRRDVADSLNNVGNVHYRRGDFGETLTCLKESLRTLGEIGDKRGMASNFNNIGNIHFKRGDDRRALEYYEKSLALHREIGDVRHVAFNLNNMGNIHLAWGDYEKALKCYEEFLTISRELGDKSGVALSLNNIGLVHGNRGDIGEALRCLEESLRIAREIGKKMSVAWCLLDMADLYRGVYDLKNAMEYHKRSLALMEQIGARDEEAMVLTSIGTDYHLSGDDEKALQYLNRALQTVEQLEIGKIEPWVVAALSEVWLSKGDFTKANEFCERLLELVADEDLRSHLARGRKIKGEILLSKANPKFEILRTKHLPANAVPACQSLGRQTGMKAAGRSAGQAGKRPAKRTADKRAGIQSSKFKMPNKKAQVEMLKHAETELKEAQRIAEEIGDLHLLWQIHASLGKVYSVSDRKDRRKRASGQFKKAKEIMEEAASRIGDERLKKIFLSSKQVRTILGSGQ